MRLAWIAGETGVGAVDGRRRCLGEMVSGTRMLQTRGRRLVAPVEGSGSGHTRSPTRHPAHGPRSIGARLPTTLHIHSRCKRPLRLSLPILPSSWGSP